ncbi:hypothetical protein AXF42_Ash015067 [Apostasia shenzhenica]|uniref:GTD-binding domain-containing protein n=1 Tax=Apostasia shenzhenica TaxID=1088818 RepID=A0A2I0B314_9ASPA|nr:hypothetical protein AXF42_Ash015067 [Apostasia shenzhenica]
MAANRFATMLHRRTNRMMFLLIHSALEWIMIVLLLLNAFLFYLIGKFASFFGLNPPCVFCSRIDHLFEPEKGRSSFRDLLCQTHASEISELELCSRYRRLTEAGKTDRSVARSMKQSDQGGKDFFCFCCRGFDSPFLLPNVGALDVPQCTQEVESVEAIMVEENYGGFESEVAEKGKSEGKGEKVEDCKCEALLQSHQSDINAEEAAAADAEPLAEEQADEEDSKVDDENDCEISIGSEICDQELIEQTELHEIIASQSVDNFDESSLTDTVSGAETKPSERAASQVQYLSVSPLLNEAEEEVMPETPRTPNSVESFHLLYKRLLLEIRESGTESLDEIIASNMDNTKPVTIDHLKAALKSERMALAALYTELEEERSASAIAANQTMAMITRLQEEKAAMQMEALHYQRMMEEQLEYDHKSLENLSELVRKMENELEVCREKVHLYEARETRKMNGTSSDSLTSEESDDSSLNEKNLTMEDEDGYFDINPIVKHQVSGENGLEIAGKRLFPLFDARSLENEEDELHHREIVAQLAR